MINGVDGVDGVDGVNGVNSVLTITISMVSRCRPGIPAQHLLAYTIIVGWFIFVGDDVRIATCWLADQNAGLSDWSGWLAVVRLYVPNLIARLSVLNHTNHATRRRSRLARRKVVVAS